MASCSILVIHTGGTIGMTDGPSGLVPDPCFADRLAPWIAAQRFPARIDVHPLETLIDSADATADHWHTIARVVVDRHAGFDGIVILHGTDTMAYSASALSFLLNGLAKPVILTGAQLPFATPGTDAERNISDALAWANHDSIREVCIAFDGQLLRGNRSVKFSTHVGDGFASPHWPVLGRSRRGRARAAQAIEPSALLRPRPASSLTLSAPDNAVGLLKIYPGLSVRLVQAAAEAHPSGLVLELYGSGTAPRLNASLYGTLNDLSRCGLPLVAVSQCTRGAVHQPAYASSHLLRDAGVIFGHDLTPEAALTKLSCLVGRGESKSDLIEAMVTSMAGEMTVPENRDLIAK